MYVRKFEVVCIKPYWISESIGFHPVQVYKAALLLWGLHKGFEHRNGHIIEVFQADRWPMPKFLTSPELHAKIVNKTTGTPQKPAKFGISHDFWYGTDDEFFKRNDIGAAIDERFEYYFKVIKTLNIVGDHRRHPGD
jgi:hypothetical protein